MSKLRSEARFTLRDGRIAVVRSAATADAGALRRLLDAVAAEPDTPLLRLPGSVSQRALRARLAAAAGHPRELWLVALVEGRLVGSMHLSGDGRVASQHVWELGVSVLREERGFGVGSALLEAALASLAGHGCTKITLSVFPHNRAAIAFYERRGFVHEGLRTRQFVRDGGYYDEVLMARLLTHSS